ncbi:hypothetical protein AA0Z93_00005, partial [Pseudomonas sp. 1P02AnB]
KFFVVTSLSLTGGSPFKSIKIGDTIISFKGSEMPRKFRSRSELAKRWKVDHPYTPTDATVITIAIQAKSPEDAFHTAFNALDYLRGILALHVNMGMKLNLTGRIAAPMNRILVEGMHTVHHENGDLATDTFWYEDRKAAKPYQIPEETLASLAKNTKKILRKIENIKDGKIIRDALIRYSRALDEKDSDHAIIRLWGALESVVSESNNAELVVRRCSYLYNEHELVKQILESARTYRNRNVHAGVTSPLSESLSYQINDIFRSLIIFYARNTFNSLREANSFLDSPIMDGDIERKIKLLRKASRFRNPGFPH